MCANETYLLIGGGYASSRTAECLRQEGLGGRIIILSEEPHLPYSRLPLCKRALKIPTDIGRLPLRHAGYYEKRNIELRLGCEVVRIARNARRVEIAGEGSLDYDKLLIAPGGSTRRLPIPRSEPPELP